MYDYDSLYLEASDMMIKLYLELIRGFIPDKSDTIIEKVAKVAFFGPAVIAGIPAIPIGLLLRKIIHGTL